MMTVKGQRKPEAERYIRRTVGFPRDVAAALKAESVRAGVPVSVAVVLAVGEWIDRRERRRAT